jgi:ElaA protein
MTIDWVCKHHSDLGKEQLYAILQLRDEVFVVEQKCVYQDIDGQDLEGDTCHLMAWDGDRLVAYLRLLDPEQQGGDVVIGRVVIAPAARGTGLGHELMAQALKQAEKYWPDVPIYLSAQAHLQGYYGRYGFVVAGEEYVEDDIPHIGMRRPEGPIAGKPAPTGFSKRHKPCGSVACPRWRHHRRHISQGYSSTALICRKLRSIHPRSIAPHSRIR